MAVIDPGHFVELFNKEWLEKVSQIVQVRIDEGKVNKVALLPHAISLQNNISGGLKEILNNEGVDIDGPFIHIEATNMDMPNPGQTHILIELDGDVVCEGRTNHLAIITDKELVSFVPAQSSELSI